MKNKIKKGFNKTSNISITATSPEGNEAFSVTKVMISPRKNKLGRVKSKELNSDLSNESV